VVLFEVSAEGEAEETGPVGAVAATVQTTVRATAMVAMTITGVATEIMAMKVTEATGDTMGTGMKAMRVDHRSGEPAAVAEEAAVAEGEVIKSLRSFC